MKGITKPFVQLNLWFLIPFCIWMLGGGLALLIFSEAQLFHFFNGQHSPGMDLLMPKVTRLGEGFAIALLTIIPFFYKRLRNWAYFAMGVIAPLLVLLVSQAIKRSLDVPRPLKVYGSESWFRKLDDWKELYHHSFPSGHTSSAFALFALLALILPLKWRMFGLHFFLLAFLVGYSRMYLSAHFFADVYAGSLIGTFISMAVALFIHNKKLLH